MAGEEAVARKEAAEEAKESVAAGAPVEQPLMAGSSHVLAAIGFASIALIAVGLVAGVGRGRQGR